MKKLWRKFEYAIGWVGVKLCDFSTYRPCTKGECASTLQYVNGMITYMEMHGEASAGEWQLRQFTHWMNDIKRDAAVN